MNNKLLTILIGLVLFSGAIALTIGENFTQTEYNQTNFDEIDFGMEIIDSYIENDRLFVKFNYNTLEKVFDENNLDTNTFEVVTKTEKIPYYLGHYRECRDTNTIEECNNVIVNFVYEKAEKFRLDEKAMLEKQKTKEIYDEVNPFDFKTLYINYDNYKVNKSYSTGNIFVYENELYEVISSHVSQNDWKPSQVPSLYKVHVLSEEGEVREWVQPISSVDAYNIGDKVTYNGKTYESLLNANTWSPTAYPAGWKQI